MPLQIISFSFRLANQVGETKTKILRNETEVLVFGLSPAYTKSYIVNRIWLPPKFCQIRQHIFMGTGL